MRKCWEFDAFGLRWLRGYGFVALLLTLCAAGPAAAATTDEMRYRQRLEALLTPLVGEDSYRLDVELKPDSQGPARVVLVLDSRSRAVREQGEDRIRQVLQWAGGFDSADGHLHIVTMPFYGAGDSLARWWRSPAAQVVLAVTLAVLLGWLLVPRFRRRDSRWTKDGGGRVAAAGAADYRDELQALRGMAADEPARVAQVLRRWINSDD